MIRLASSGVKSSTFGLSFWSDMTVTGAFGKSLSEESDDRTSCTIPVRKPLSEEIDLTQAWDRSRSACGRAPAQIEGATCKEARDG